MKRLYILLAGLCCAAAASSQHASRHFFVSLDQSLVIPVGQFGNKTYSVSGAPRQDISGLALPGFHFSATGGYQFHRNFSVLLLAGYGWNRQDKKSFEDFSQVLMGDGYNLSIKNKSWAILRTLTGLGWRQAISRDQKLYAEFQLMAGIAKTNEPGVEISGVKSDMSPVPGAFQLKMAKKNLPASFAWQGSGGIGYQLDRNVFLLLNVYYFDASPAYKFDYTPPPYNPDNYQAQPGKFKYSLSSIGLNVSAGWRFN